MFEFTLIVLRLLREGKLYAMCNERESVFDTTSEVYSCLFMKFMTTYIEGRHDITKMDELNKELDRQARSNIRHCIKDFYGAKPADIHKHFKLLIQNA